MRNPHGERYRVEPTLRHLAVAILVAALGAARRSANAERAAALHLLLGLAWLAIGSVGWVGSVITGSDRIFIGVVVIFALGTVVQSLIGAWSHLTPMSRPGGPDIHRVLLARADIGARLQVLVFNTGVTLVVAAVAGAPTGGSGVALIVRATLFALAKVTLPARPTRVEVA
jgi:hypothetical protein